MVPLLMALAPTIVQGLRSRTRSKFSFFVTLGILAVASVLLFFEARAFDGAVWKQAEAGVAAGTPAMDIDAGFAWYGLHSSASVNQHPVPDGTKDFSPYVDMFSDAKECVVIGAYDPDYENAQVVSTYKRYLFFGSDVAIYRDQVEPCR